MEVWTRRSGDCLALPGVSVRLSYGAVLLGSDTRPVCYYNDTHRGRQGIAGCPGPARGAEGNWASANPNEFFGRRLSASGPSLAGGSS